MQEILNPTRIQQLTTIRKKLHANPEVAQTEFNTQKQIIEFLEKESNASFSKLANTGVLATFDSGKSGPTILIRGDIDALPIQEMNHFEHRSLIDGVSHKCGHDGHTTILLGLSALFSQKQIQKGKVLLLFQPAEENGMGAEACIKDPIFQAEKIDFVFALHNLPGYAKHEIVVRDQEFTGNVTSIIIQLDGKTAHAAEPEKGINPSLAIAEILQYAEKITLNEPADKHFFLVTPIHITMGELAYGISAGSGEIHFTIRSWSTQLMKEKNERFVQFLEETAKKQGLKLKIAWTQVFHANLNDPSANHFIRNAARKLNLPVTERAYPFKWGEDFGLFTQQFKGAMFGLGAGIDSPALHNPDYDFPDEITPTGIHLFYEIIQQILD